MRRFLSPIIFRFMPSRWNIENWIWKSKGRNKRNVWRPKSLWNDQHSFWIEYNWTFL